MSPIPPAGRNGPTADRLREIGVRDTARTLSLLSDLLHRLPRKHAGWDHICRAAVPAPDPDLFFLNLSRWVDSLRRFPHAGVAARTLPPIERCRGLGVHPEQIAEAPRSFSCVLFIEDGCFGVPGRSRGPGGLEGRTRAATEDELKRPAPE